MRAQTGWGRAEVSGVRFRVSGGARAKGKRLVSESGEVVGRSGGGVD